MLIIQLKPKETILPLCGERTFILLCEGCREVFFPETQVAQLCDELLAGVTSGSLTADYICNPSQLLFQLENNREALDAADTVLVFACGVGVQTVAECFPDKRVFAACDTYPLPGDQGLTPFEFDCAQCGECHLNATGGICPITACSKSLVNGQCGGAKNGKCEVNKDMDCGWERIYRRLEKLGQLEVLQCPPKVRDFATDLAR